ncbi:MAG: serine hydroxymethyltransferase [Rhodospirillales bacterium]|nr:serine hydroxymethyltransferase [Rhodospirillales bacterium]
MHASGDPAVHVSRPLADADPEVRAALDDEARRQCAQIELIASENVMSRAVREALGHEIGNKTLEGYPGNRFHGGGEHVDVVERLAIKRAKQLFGSAYANVQPHSGTQANQAVFFALLRPGDRILSLELAAGGHLSHGAGANLSGRWFDSRHYGVDRASGLLDYDAIEARAREVRPALLIVGGSAYPRTIDFERMAAIAEAVEARLLVDMAHIAGLVAAGVHASPVPHADIVTATTTKTLRGPRGGIILARSNALAKRLQSAVFPGIQGSLHSNVLAAKAVCLGEALRPEFRDYGWRVVENARTLAATIAERGIGIVSGGTDTHMVLLDLASVGLVGQQAETVLARVGITSNRNPVPFDPPGPSRWTGLRLGTAAVTTRGFGTTEMEVLGACIADLLHAEARSDPGPALARSGPKVAQLAQGADGCGPA